jgi:hypothetical protein
LGIVIARLFRAGHLGLRELPVVVERQYFPGAGSGNHRRPEREGGQQQPC